MVSELARSVLCQSVAEPRSAPNGKRLGLRALIPTHVLHLRPRLVPISVAVVLIGAALLKTDKLWNEPASDPTFIGSWGAVTLIEFELALGLGLLSNLWPHALRRIAFVLFAAFSGV